MAVRVFYTNPVSKMRWTCRTRISPLDGWNVLRAKKASNYEKTVEGESGRQKEKKSRKYISPEDVQRVKGSRKDCQMNVQARCEEKLRTDRLFSLFPLQNSNYRIGKENACRGFSVYVFWMSALTEVAQKGPKWRQKIAKSALYFQSNALAVLNRRQKRELENTRKKNYFRRWEGESWSETSCCPSTEHYLLSNLQT